MYRDFVLGVRVWGEKGVEVGWPHLGENPSYYIIYYDSNNLQKHLFNFVEDHKSLPCDIKLYIPLMATLINLNHYENNSHTLSFHVYTVFVRFIFVCVCEIK